MISKKGKVTAILFQVDCISPTSSSASQPFIEARARVVAAKRLGPRFEIGKVGNRMANFAELIFHSKAAAVVFCGGQFLTVLPLLIPPGCGCHTGMSLPRDFKGGGVINSPG